MQNASALLHLLQQMLSWIPSLLGLWLAGLGGCPSSGSSTPCPGKEAHLPDFSGRRWPFLSSCFCGSHKMLQDCYLFGHILGRYNISEQWVPMGLLLALTLDKSDRKNPWHHPQLGLLIPLSKWHSKEETAPPLSVHAIAEPPWHHACPCGNYPCKELLVTATRNSTNKFDHRVLEVYLLAILYNLMNMFPLCGIVYFWASMPRCLLCLRMTFEESNHQQLGSGRHQATLFDSALWRA